jgi:hypothetical protein
VILSGHTSNFGVGGRIFIAVVCFVVALQGAHVCPPPGASAHGIQVAISPGAPVCSVCALAQSVLIILLFILFSLIPTHSRTPLVSVQVRPFWHGVRLDMRAPPVF